MALKTYSYNDSTQLTPHFNVREWKCKCGRQHEIKINDNLPTLLENLMSKIGAEHGYIYSGYRCYNHDRAVKGSGYGPHTEGYAVDIYFTDKTGKRISSRTVALALEDMGHKCGIGYRCGGGSDESGQTHIDVKPRKWYGNEAVSMSTSCCSSFYDYFGIKKQTSSSGSDIVKSLQMALNECGANLVIDGIKENATDRAINKYYNCKSVIKWVQQRLNNLGYNCGTVDGIRGNNTRNGTKAFQRDNGLIQDCIAGLNTISKML